MRVREKSATFQSQRHVESTVSLRNARKRSIFSILFIAGPIHWLHPFQRQSTPRSCEAFLPWDFKVLLDALDAGPSQCPPGSRGTWGGWGNQAAGRDVDGGAGIASVGFEIPSASLSLGHLAFGGGPGTPCDRTGNIGNFW